MPKLSGLEWLRLTAIKPVVIITTAFKEYTQDESWIFVRSDKKIE